MKQFLDLVLGTTDYVSFAASAFFALLGVLLCLLFHANSRNPMSDHSPIPFVWSYLITDNLARISSSIILVFFFLRFSEYLIGEKASLYLSAIIGASCDRLGKIVQSKLLG